MSDIGVHHNWLIQFCKPKRPDSLIGSMGFGPMGFGVAGALGAKLAAPQRPCVAVVGDGAFLMHANVLGTAYQYEIPVVYVVWNNYAYGSIRGLQRGYLGGRELATDFRHPGTTKPYNPDFAAHGARGRHSRGERRPRRAILRKQCARASRAASRASSTPISTAISIPRARGSGNCPAWGAASPVSASSTSPRAEDTASTLDPRRTRENRGATKNGSLSVAPGEPPSQFLPDEIDGAPREVRERLLHGGGSRRVRMRRSTLPADPVDSAMLSFLPLIRDRLWNARD